LPAIRIVRFRKEHLPRIMQIERASFGRDAYSRSLFRELHGAHPGLFLVARRGTSVSGYIVGCAGAGIGEIVSVAVDPAHRGAGVGAALVEHLLGKLAAAGVARVELMVRLDNHPAIRFYRQFGFRRVHRVPGYYEDGADGWLMRKAPVRGVG
jgi:ribosomal-protein-alanine N-acetyltransferase